MADSAADTVGIMLRPQDSAYRERKSLDGLWEFALGAQPEPGHGTGPVFDHVMAVPASYNDILPGGRDHVGVAWYRRTVVVPRGWAGQRILLHLESATHRATVWAGDTEVVTHEGGYTPFEADVTDHATPGRELTVTVAVDNTLTFASVPPGVVEDGRQRYWHDFFNYAGLHRSVWLCAVPHGGLSEVDVDAAADGTLTWRVPGDDVRVVLHDASGAVVATGRGATGTLRVDGVRRWQPGDGYLYELRAHLLRDGETVDEYRLPVGFRSVEVRGTRFLVNGEPFHFRGFGRHEDIPVIGKGHNDAYLVHDFALLDWIGANSFRTSHYPYSERVLDLADRRGILVIDETAAVGLNTRLAQGTAARAAYRTFGPDTVGERTRQTHAQALRELIARDRNHPSVVMWSVANEPESDAEGAEDYFRPLFALARELDPSRPVSFAGYGEARHGACRVSQFADVLMLNRYYGWYVHTGELDAAERALEEELRAWAADGKPILISEYGADTLPGLHALDPVPWTEEYQSAYLARQPASAASVAATSSSSAARSGASRASRSRGEPARDRYGSAPASATGAPAPRRWAIHAASNRTAPCGMRPAARSARSTGSNRIGIFSEPSAATCASVCRIRWLPKRSSRLRRYAVSSAPGSGTCRDASSHHWSSHVRQAGSAAASATVSWPRALAAYASSECAPLSSNSLRCSYGVTSATNRAPALAQSGRPAGKSPLSTHSAYGSVTTGAASSWPVASRTTRRSSSVVCGVIRSTMVVTNDTESRIQVLSAGSASPAMSATTRAVRAPLPGRLSHGTTASGPQRAARRAASPAISRPGTVVTGPSPRRSAVTSARTSARCVSRPPPGPRR
ncbi:hypothetical protein GCM10012284_43670 [Mangrovihabitans endophyticus]|uniref:Beta-glucuronidase n=1 Tax=Mangrovihabitans endophyticus TaxID=1751298 RepID=A0A8J3C176_9ACTN|nr:hypothetical protein GCM10012284_43670 [Mangrovihabitans endophyticus]